MTAKEKVKRLYELEYSANIDGMQSLGFEIIIDEQRKTTLHKFFNVIYMDSGFTVRFVHEVSVFPDNYIKQDELHYSAEMIEYAWKRATEMRLGVKDERITNSN